MKLVMLQDDAELRSRWSQSCLIPQQEHYKFSATYRKCVMFSEESVQSFQGSTSTHTQYNLANEGKFLHKPDSRQHTVREVTLEDGAYLPSPTKTDRAKEDNSQYN